MKCAKNTPFKTLIIVSLAFGLGACDGSEPASSGSLNLNITDAPIDIDKVERVVVEFSGVEIKPADGPAISFDFTEKCDADPALCQIDLLAYANGASVPLLDGETVPSGQYNWLRLMVNAEPIVEDSYIDINGQRYELRIPSGAQTGLKLNRGFVVPAGGVADYTIDFDLRKSVHDPVGKPEEYILRPTLRMVDNSKTSTLKGNVDASYFASGDCSGAVYVFDSSVATPDDEDGEGIGGPDPIASAMVADDGVYAYTVSFLPEGDYLIAFTCDAMADDPAVDDDSTTVSFLGSSTVGINANDYTVYNFVP